MRRLCADAERAAKDGCTLLILSDRGVSAERAPIPSLLAVSAVHHHLIEAGERWHASLIVESGEPREVHHFAALAGYGANAINPWLALDAVASAWEEAGGAATGMSLHDAQHNFIKSVEKGIMKVMSKMGIATLDSYCGAQVFEAIGLSERLIQEAFPGTPDFRIGGIGFTDLAEDVLAWHRNAFPGANGERRAHGGRRAETRRLRLLQDRRGGEYHAYNPEVVRALHEVVGLAKPANQQISKTGKRANRQIGKSARRRSAICNLQSAIGNLPRLPALCRPGAEPPAGRATRPAAHRHGPAAADPDRRGRVDSGHPAPLLQRRDVARRVGCGGA